LKEKPVGDVRRIDKEKRKIERYQCRLGSRGVNTEYEKIK